FQKSNILAVKGKYITINDIDALSVLAGNNKQA
ncbi:MAG: transcriptional regulator FNR, partial [Plesiomonas shigelloides]